MWLNRPGPENLKHDCLVLIFLLSKKLSKVTCDNFIWSKLRYTILLFLIGQIGYNKRMIYQVKHKDNCVLSMSSAAKKNTLNAPYNQNKKMSVKGKIRT